jgi:peptidoglycan L-alanyl-D-glutamate endopeptidase CwlK
MITREGGLRTLAEQEAIYAQGRTRPGRIVTHAPAGLSNHNYGLAVDLVPLVNGRPTWQVVRSVWQAIGDEGKGAGLSWGGDWITIKDYPHFELPVGLSVQQCLRIYNQGGLPAVWAEASRRLATR